MLLTVASKVLCKIILERMGMLLRADSGMNKRDFVRRDPAATRLLH